MIARASEAQQLDLFGRPRPVQLRLVPRAALLPVVGDVAAELGARARDRSGAAECISRHPLYMARRAAAKDAAIDAERARLAALAGLGAQLSPLTDKQAHAARLMARALRDQRARFSSVDQGEIERSAETLAPRLVRAGLCVRDLPQLYRHRSGSLRAWLLAHESALEVPAPRVSFFVGAHRPQWLELSPVPLFVSDATLRKRRQLPRAFRPWALDSGAFSEVSQHGAHLTDARTYARRVLRYQDEIGALSFASIQDFMCEPPVLARTRLSVADHQALTIDSYVHLRSIAPDVPWLPVVQGWCRGDHEEHVEAYARRGIDLTEAPRVGVGSICRRQGTTSASIIVLGLHMMGLKLHGFGLKTEGLGLSVERLASADSMAWSTHERAKHRAKRLLDPSLPKTGDQNSLDAALVWYRDAIVPRIRGEVQP